MYSKSNNFKEFEQKVRNRPIQITDVAIEKVRKTQIFGFRPDENEIIQEQHKRLLSISKNMNNSEEVAIIIDIIHWKTEVIIGKLNHIALKSNPDAYRMIKQSAKNTILAMHNHPSTSTFSGVDFKTFCDNKSIFVMTIVGNDGSVQVMGKQYNFDGDLAKLKYGNIADQYKNKGYINNGTMAMRYVIKNPNEFNILYKHGGKKQ